MPKSIFFSHNDFGTLSEAGCQLHNAYYTFGASLRTCDDVAMSVARLPNPLGRVLTRRGAASGLLNARLRTLFFQAVSRRTASEEATSSSSSAFSLATNESALKISSNQEKIVLVLLRSRVGSKWTTLPSGAVPPSTAAALWHAASPAAQLPQQWGRGSHQDRSEMNARGVVLRDSLSVPKGPLRPESPSCGTAP